MTTNVRDIPLSDIIQGTNYSRSLFDPASMTSLKKSISDFGLLQAVGVSPNEKNRDKFDLIYGYRRFQAFVELGKTTIPASIVSNNPIDEDDRMRMNVTENNERKPVTIIESGLRWMRLVTSKRYTTRELSYIEGIDEKKIINAIDMYRKIPAHWLKNIVANDVRTDQSNLITQSKAHAIMTAIKNEGVMKHIDDLFELVRRNNANEKEIMEVGKFIQSGLSPDKALVQVRSLRSRYLSKTLTFKVRKNAWNTFKDQYGYEVSNVVRDAIKKHDTAKLREIASFLC